jgi:hypothetical protein
MTTIRSGEGCGRFISLDVCKHPAQAVDVEMQDNGQRDCHYGQAEQLNNCIASRLDERSGVNVRP